MKESNSNIIMYKSSFCGHSLAVERFLKQHDITIELINIDRDPEARQKVMELNGGYASVPTLIFPDGTQLTEPSFRDLKSAFEIKPRGLMAWVGSLFGRNQ